MEQLNNLIIAEQLKIQSAWLLLSLLFTYTLINIMITTSSQKNNSNVLECLKLILSVGVILCWTYFYYLTHK